MLKGLLAFQQDYPQAQAYLLYRGKARLKKGSISCVPCDEFLEQLRPHQDIGMDETVADPS
jgi:hypothetical protein